MTAIDYSIIVIYFLVVIGLGFWYQKRASQGLKAYFLGKSFIARISWVVNQNNFITIAF